MQQSYGQREYVQCTRKCSYQNSTLEVTGRDVCTQRSYQNKYGEKQLTEHQLLKFLHSALGHLWGSDCKQLKCGGKEAFVHGKCFSQKTCFHYNDESNLAEKIRFLEFLVNLIQQKPDLSIFYHCIRIMMVRVLRFDYIHVHVHEQSTTTP